MDIPEQDVLLRELRDDVRSLKQSMEQVVFPRLVEDKKRLDKLNARFGTALYIIGGAIGAATFLISKGVVPR